MITRLFYILALLVLLLQMGRTQSLTDQPRNAIQLTFGYHHAKLQDLIYSPMIYRGSSTAALALSYEYHRPGGLHRFRAAVDRMEVSGADLITFQLSSGSETRQPSEALQVDLSYGYSHRITGNEAWLQFYLGAMLETRMHLVDFAFALSDEDGYALTNSLRPWLVAALPLNEEMGLQAELHFPLLALVSRPDYAIVDNESIQHEGSDLGYIYGKGEWTSLDDYQAVNVSLFYNWRLSPSFAAGIGYRLDLQKIRNPLSITVLKSNVDLGFSFLF